MSVAQSDCYQATAMLVTLADPSQCKVVSLAVHQVQAAQ
jgi:hypothetical protein